VAFLEGESWEFSSSFLLMAVEKAGENQQAGQRLKKVVPGGNLLDLNDIIRYNVKRT
jgi:hypothetical protein